MVDKRNQQEQPDPRHTMLELWRTHQLEIKLITHPIGIEELTVWASIIGDQTSSQAQRIWHVLASEKPTGKLELTTRTLWVLDLGYEWYPLYAEDEQTAQHLAQLVEEGRNLPRLSLVQVPAGRGIYAGKLTVMGHTIERQDARKGTSHRRQVKPQKG